MNGREITLDNTESLVKVIASRKINRSKFQEECNSIVNAVDAILQKPMLTRSQDEMVRILSHVNEIPMSKYKKRMNNQTLQTFFN